MNARTALALGFVSCLGLTGLVGCDGAGFTSKTAKSPSQAQARKDGVGTAETTGANLGARSGGEGPAVETSGLSVSDEIAQACGIPRPTGSRVSPSFEFDSSALGQDDRDMLALVAKCLTEGALRGKSVMLVGRTDPRGEAEYNMNLGGSRSDAVRRYMQDLGVQKDRLNATSRGELDAKGKDESSWAEDRRVDIQLVK